MTQTFIAVPVDLIPISAPIVIERRIGSGRYKGTLHALTESDVSIRTDGAIQQFRKVDVNTYTHEGIPKIFNHLEDLEHI